MDRLNQGQYYDGYAQLQLIIRQAMQPEQPRNLLALTHQPPPNHGAGISAMQSLQSYQSCAISTLISIYTHSDEEMDCSGDIRDMQVCGIVEIACCALWGVQWLEWHTGGYWGHRLPLPHQTVHAGQQYLVHRGDQRVSDAQSLDTVAGTGDNKISNLKPFRKANLPNLTSFTICNNCIQDLSILAEFYGPKLNSYDLERSQDKNNSFNLTVFAKIDTNDPKMRICIGGFIVGGLKDKRISQGNVLRAMGRRFLQQQLYLST